MIYAIEICCAIYLDNSHIVFLFIFFILADIALCESTRIQNEEFKQAPINALANKLDPFKLKTIYFSYVQAHYLWQD